MSIELPRRELNRVHTWIAIHEAGCALVLRDGLAAATVDAISEQAEVSRRTFFNYFPAKEDAVLGIKPPRISEESLEAFDQSTDLLGRVVYLMSSTVRTAVHFDTSVERRELLKRYPELRTRLDQQLREVEALVQSVLTERSSASSESSRALVMFAGTVLRFAFALQPDGTIDDSPRALDAAISQFKEVVKEVL
ncbi:MAG: TetR/AcrR family transcriptional regulator [Rhodoglobus sp.]